MYVRIGGMEGAAVRHSGAICTNKRETRPHIHRFKYSVLFVSIHTYMHVRICGMDGAVAWHSGALCANKRDTRLHIYKYIYSLIFVSI